MFALPQPPVRLNALTLAPLVIYPRKKPQTKTLSPQCTENTMSWQAYVDNNLVGAGLKQAAIFGHNGTCWAASTGFNVTETEAAALCAAYTDPSGIRARGLFLEGVKYFTLRADDRSVYGKKGPGGVVAVKTLQAILIGIYDEKTQPGQAANIVEKLADYLIDQGY